MTRRTLHNTKNQFSRFSRYWVALVSLLVCSGTDGALASDGVKTEMVCTRDEALKRVSAEELATTLLRQATYRPGNKIVEHEKFVLGKYPNQTIRVSWVLDSKFREFFDQNDEQRITREIVRFLEELDGKLDINFKILKPGSISPDDQGYAPIVPELTFTYDDNLVPGPYDQDVISEYFDVARLAESRGNGTLLGSFNGRPWTYVFKISQPIDAVPELMAGNYILKRHGGKDIDVSKKYFRTYTEFFGSSGRRISTNVSIGFVKRMSLEQYISSAKQAILAALIGPFPEKLQRIPLCYMTKVLYNSGVQSGASLKEARKAFLDYIANDQSPQRP